MDKDHIELLDGVEEESYYETHFDRHKRKYTVTVSMFLVLLMLSFSISSFPIGDVLASLVVSSVLDLDNSMDFSEGKIVLSSEVAAYLSELYANEVGSEISVCLEGTISSSGDELEYNVESYYIPEIFYRSFSHVRFESCSSETIIALHTHPRGRCIASPTDLNTLSVWQENYGLDHLIMMIQCGNRRFKVKS